MQDYDPNSAGSAAAVLAIFSALLIPILVISVISIVGQWKVYTKAGKPGWACIVPIYNLIVLLEIVGKPVWWIFLFLIPCVNIIFIVWTINLLSKSFGQGAGFTIGLFILGFIFWPLLGFGNYQYIGPGGLKNPFGADNYQDPFNNPPQV